MLFETRSFLATACNRSREGRGLSASKNTQGQEEIRGAGIMGSFEVPIKRFRIVFLNANAERSFLSLKAVAIEQASCAMSLSHHVGCYRPLPPDYGCHSISRTQLAISGAASTRF